MYEYVIVHQIYGGQDITLTFIRNSQALLPLLSSCKKVITEFFEADKVQEKPCQLDEAKGTLDSENRNLDFNLAPNIFVISIKRFKFFTSLYLKILDEMVS